VRTSLLPGLLKTVSANRAHALPLRVFEVSDVVLKDDAVERRARNERRFAALWVGRVSAFEVLHGLLDRIMAMLNVRTGTGPTEYAIGESNGTWFFGGRCG